ncbi:hypothetical protein F3Y22_tig00005406pilonHSYRG00066 [Hibiscus syriacus]|uniref:Uncharacterized protein n=1 Tax=Hibiscus syriacus TaxID=106335 RepID=A0A6A3CFY2_HIBSY|nr:hypothetical protein F3Y22_tig00005406pilonHSYRG00066 [Hibiscus syriacus]
MTDELERLAVARELTSGGSLGSGVTGEDHARLGKLNSQRRLAGLLMSSSSVNVSATIDKGTTEFVDAKQMDNEATDELFDPHQRQRLKLELELQ